MRTLHDALDKIVVEHRAGDPRAGSVYRLSD